MAVSLGGRQFCCIIVIVTFSLTISDRDTKAVKPPQAYENSGDMMLLQYRAQVRRQ